MKLDVEMGDGGEVLEIELSDEQFAALETMWLESRHLFPTMEDFLLDRLICGYIRTFS